MLAILKVVFPWVPCVIMSKKTIDETYLHHLTFLGFFCKITTIFWYHKIIFTTTINTTTTIHSIVYLLGHILVHHLLIHLHLVIQLYTPDCYTVLWHLKLQNKSRHLLQSMHLFSSSDNNLGFIFSCLIVNPQQRGNPNLLIVGGALLGSNPPGKEKLTKLRAFQAEQLHLF